MLLSLTFKRLCQEKIMKETIADKERMKKKKRKWDKKKEKVEQNE